MTKLAIVLLAVFAAPTVASAQKKKKKEEEKVPVYNYVIDDPMDVFGRQPVPADEVVSILLPEFFMSGSHETQKKDTTFQYLGYNAANEIILPDTLMDYRKLRFVSIVKSYPDPVQQYKDADGNLQPLPIQKITHRYDKVGSDKWLYVDYATNKQATLQEYAGVIVRTDTAGSKISTAGNRIITLYKYYKVTPTN